MGDYRLSTGLNTARWAMNPGKINFSSGTHDVFQEYDYDYALTGFKDTGAPVVKEMSLTARAVAGDLGSAFFAMAIDLETSNGLEISGLNAEEQSDISLIARYSDAQSSDFAYDVFTYIDSMVVLRENNVLELIQ